MDTAATPLVQVRGLTKSYAAPGGRSLTVLRDLELSAMPGEMIAIVGASGVGKSTLLHVLGGLDAFDTGEIAIGGQQLHTMSDAGRVEFRNQRIGFVFQFHHLLPEFTALENVCLPAYIQNRPAALTREEAAALLKDVGLEHRMQHKPGELSGGEQQRVAVARALMQRPDVVLADEPTGNLDTHTGDALFGLMRTLNRDRGITFVIVTHNEKLSAQADRIIHMEDGMVKQG